MKYEELKSMVFDIVTREALSDRQSLVKRINESFEKYEKENEEITEENIKNIGEKFQSWNAKAFHKALTDYHNQIESMQKEIFELSCFRKKFGECLDDQRNDLSLLKKHILDLQDELLTLKRDLKFEKEQENPKQERFYYLQFITEGSDFEYEVIDRKGLFDCDGIFTKSQAFEICKALNQMEGGGK